MTLPELFVALGKMHEILSGNAGELLTQGRTLLRVTDKDRAIKYKHSLRNLGLNVVTHIHEDSRTYEDEYWLHVRFPNELKTILFEEEQKDEF